MKIAKKKLQEINRITFIDEIIRNFYTLTNADFLDHNPENWDSTEKEVFDLLAELESKLKHEIIETLTKTKP